jgi:DGQHR domain-containing protein
MKDKMKDSLIFHCNRFMQNSQEYISLILPFHVIEKYSEVLVYGKHPQGYQREPEPNHYHKIRDYILNDKEFILPTSLVLAVDESDINKMIIGLKSEQKIDINNAPGKKKIFRIVDGQHRILGMREAIKDKPNLINFYFSVIILVTKPNKRSIEMEVFYYINSKGKRLKVDLIELARFNYRILEKNLKGKEINEHIAIQTSYYLNEITKDSIWKNAIKIGIHDEEVIGLIGVNAFRESIGGIVDAYLKIDENNKYINLKGEQLIEYSQKSASKIAEYLHKAWDKSVKDKWNYCFKKGDTVMDLFLEPKEIFYNAKFYLQRTMGAKAINGILSNIVNGRANDNIVGLSNASLKEFDRIIKSSKVSSDDWEVGGTFSGYSSESGFKKVSKFITNELPIPRTFK